MDCFPLDLEYTLNSDTHKSVEEGILQKAKIIVSICYLMYMNKRYRLLRYERLGAKTQHSSIQFNFFFFLVFTMNLFHYFFSRSEYYQIKMELLLNIGRSSKKT